MNDNKTETEIQSAINNDISFAEKLMRDNHISGGVIDVQIVRPTHSITKYGSGSVGNGITDDTEAMRSLINGNAVSGDFKIELRGDVKCEIKGNTFIPCRTVIIGAPRTGKTTLAAEMGGSRSTNETMDMEWSAASAAVVEWLREPYTIIEGVALARALRKFHATYPDDAPPVDKIIYLKTPREELTKGQAAMGKGIETVWKEIEPWLRENGVEIEYR